MLGVSAGHSECVVLLLKYGANTNLVDEDQHPALFRAVSGSHCDNVIEVTVQDSGVLLTLWFPPGGAWAPRDSGPPGGQGGESHIPGS